MTQSATPATRNGVGTSSDTSKKFCDFSHRHGNFHTSQRQNQRFPTGFLMDLLQNRRFVRGFRRFSRHVTKCHACHGIYTLSALRAALTMRFTENTQHHTSEVLRLPRKMTSECCACHEKCNTSSENVAKVLRLPHKRLFDAS